MKKRLVHHSKTALRRSPPDHAQQMAVEALAFLATNPDRLQIFFDLTGLTIDTLRLAAAQPGFGAGVLEYLCGNEAMLTAFASQHGYDPGDVDAARISLMDQPEPQESDDDRDRTWILP